ncbi:hypothetical protein K501DRAFT_278459 [Backusella circina FSU 941]|nr:hypothetical protein K501DRAFT_278459 [Backusella circina FSU 941]
MDEEVSIGPTPLSGEWVSEILLVLPRAGDLTCINSTLVMGCPDVTPRLLHTSPSINTQDRVVYTVEILKSAGVTSAWTVNEPNVGVVGQAVDVPADGSRRTGAVNGVDGAGVAVPDGAYGEESCAAAGVQLRSRQPRTQIALHQPALPRTRVETNNEVDSATGRDHR